MIEQLCCYIGESGVQMDLCTQWRTPYILLHNANFIKGLQKKKLASSNIVEKGKNFIKELYVCVWGGIPILSYWCGKNVNFIIRPCKNENFVKGLLKKNAYFMKRLQKKNTSFMNESQKNHEFGQRILWKESTFSENQGSISIVFIKWSWKNWQILSKDHKKNRNFPKRLEKCIIPQRIMEKNENFYIEFFYFVYRFFGCFYYQNLFQKWKYHCLKPCKRNQKSRKWPL